MQGLHDDFTHHHRLPALPTEKCQISTCFLHLEHRLLIQVVINSSADLRDSFALRAAHGRERRLRPRVDQAAAGAVELLHGLRRPSPVPVRRQRAVPMDPDLLHFTALPGFIDFHSSRQRVPWRHTRDPSFRTTTSEGILATGLQPQGSGGSFWGPPILCLSLTTPMNIPGLLPASREIWFIGGFWKAESLTPSFPRPLSGSRRIPS